MSPNFFEMDALDVLRSPIPPNTISENKGKLKSSLQYNYILECSTLLCANIRH